MSEKLSGRLALITGASRGVGAAVAQRFAREGCQLILVGRNTASLEEIDDNIKANGGKTSTLVPFDLSNFEKIDELGSLIAQRFGKLDILVGNAAILGNLGPVSHIVPKVWDRVIATNLTANYRILRSFDPLLHQSDSGRAIFVTSTIVSNKKAFWAPYSVSKAALENLVLTYAQEIDKTKVKANLIALEPVRTRMRAEAMPGEIAATLRDASSVTDIFVELASAEFNLNGKIFNY